tara:strand:- start:1684 stop:2088 length:405 start_codon:yes stop_codon:yes gene_type:complete
MGNVLKIVRCGHCNVLWTSEVEESDSLCGPPHIKCRACKKINNTNRVLYRDMDIGDKIWVFGGLFLAVLFYGIFPVVLGVFAIIWGKDAGVIAIGIGAFGIWWGLFKQIDFFKKNDALYDKNGGFVWSNEEYPR